MNVSVRPPDFYRLFTAADASPLQPPPLPTAGSTYTQFGATYAEPPVFVAPLASFGRQQLYDERCLVDPSTPEEAASWPTPQGELRRLSADTRDAITRLLLSCQHPDEDTRALASQLELLFVNMQHLAARLRQHEALAALVREYEDVIAQAAALTRTEGGREGAAAQAPT